MEDSDLGVSTVVIAIATVLLLVAVGIIVLGPRSSGTEPGDALDTASTTGELQHVHGESGTVSERLSAAPEQVAFCVSASLEPFDVSLQQLAEGDTAGEVVERFRRCLLDTVLDHADDATIRDLASHVDHFAACFVELRTLDRGSKQDAVTHTASCIDRPQSSLAGHLPG